MCSSSKKSVPSSFSRTSSVRSVFTAYVTGHFGALVCTVNHKPPYPRRKEGTRKISVCKISTVVLRKLNFSFLISFDVGCRSVGDFEYVYEVLCEDSRSEKISILPLLRWGKTSALLWWWGGAGSLALRDNLWYTENLSRWGGQRIRGEGGVGAGSLSSVTLGIVTLAVVQPFWLGKIITEI